MGQAILGGHMKFIAAAKNPTEPWGRRPYHRLNCSEVTKLGTVQRNWEPYDPASVIPSEKRRPCKRCRPSN